MASEIDPFRSASVPVGRERVLCTPLGCLYELSVAAIGTVPMT